MATTKKKQDYARKQKERIIIIPKPVLNDLTKFWINAGYTNVNDKTLEKGLANQLIDEDDLIINKGGGGKRRRIALLKRFGKIKLNNTQYIRLNHDDNQIFNYKKGGKIRRKDYQIQIPPKFGYVPKSIVHVEIFGTVIDKIPIVTIEYGAFVKGQYKTKSGKVDRELRIEGVKQVKMGIRAPTGVYEPTFWANVYKELKDTLIDEFFKEGFKADNWAPDPDFEAEVKSNVTSGGARIRGLQPLPDRSIELRQK